MKRSFTTALMLSLASGCLTLFLTGLAPVAKAQSLLTIDLDGERRIVLKAAAKDVIIGNPAVADVTMVSPTNLIVIGHAPGRTHLLVLDADQTPLIDQVVVVTEGATGLVSVFGPRSGAITQDDYACAPHCTLMAGARAASGGGGGGEVKNFTISETPSPNNPQAPANNQPPQQAPAQPATPPAPPPQGY